MHVYNTCCFLMPKKKCQYIISAITLATYLYTLCKIESIASIRYTQVNRFWWIYHIDLLTVRDIYKISNYIYKFALFLLENSSVFEGI